MMKIDDFEVFKISMEMKDPYEVAYNRFERAENLLIRISAGRMHGWGCVAPDPHVTGENIENLYIKAKEILPELLLKRDPFRKALIFKYLKHASPGMFSLWAGVDMSLWDLLGKRAQLPIWKILGGYRDRISTSVTIGICGIQDTLRKAVDLVDQGFHILKIKGGNNVSEDIERLQVVRATLEKDIKIRFDANQGYSVEEALFFVRKIKELNIQLFEQPTVKSKPDLLGVVTNKANIPIMADESLISLMDAFYLVRKGLIDLMNIKLMKVGGISEAIQVDGLARAAGVEVMVGCMDEAALGISAGLHFALSRRNIRFADLDGHLGLIDDPTNQCISIIKGKLFPSSLPGFGWSGL
jgi:L-alanine-DL-glutamate epimerase-like enolase superfamily enzyme